jgi:hypothetical protein
MDSFAVKAIVVVFLSIALYNFLELNAYILTAFKRRSGLYFWSFTVSTWGVAFNSVGYLLKHLHVTSKNNLYSTLILIGWCTMITGQSVVLYSRLHIVMHNRQRLRAVLIMIITNAIWLHIPIIILVYGANSTNPGPYEKPYSIYEKIQLSVFITQELIISGLYLWETSSMLKLERTIGNNGTRIVLRHLLLVNVIVILLDFSILGLEFANLFEIQTAWKPLVYSVKLKLEFSILNRLVELTRSARSGDPNNSHSYSRNAARSGNLALGTFKGTTVHRSVAQGADTANKWEIHVGAGKHDNPALPSTVIKTTEFKIQSHSRRKSEVSLAESGTEGLVDSAAPDSHEPGTSGASGASSASSHVRGGSYQDQSWR